jgi:hypothetical protein
LRHGYPFFDVHAGPPLKPHGGIITLSYFYQRSWKRFVCLAFAPHLFKGFKWAIK